MPRYTRRTTPCSSPILWGSNDRSSLSGVTARVIRRLIASASLLLVAAAPVRLSSQTSEPSFAALVARLSEPGGYFDSDNIITNEKSYLQVADQLAKVGVHGGVYIGVGPDQNFSYIALIRPSIAFLVDVRRDNLLEHLLFRSLFLMSRNRAEYLCLLTGRPVPPDVAAWSGRPTQELLAYIARTPADSAAVIATRKESNERITSFGVPLDAHDRAVIDRYRAEFVASGLDTRYSSLGRNNRMGYPSFGDLIAAVDRGGRQIGYLADENAFQLVRAMERDGRIVPVIGDVAGNKAVRAIGAYSTEHHLNVSAFYLSNVEQYLIERNEGFDRYAANVKALPHDSTSVIVRSYFGRLGRAHPLFIPTPGNVSTSMIETVDSFLRRYSAGEIRGYSDLVMSGYVTP
jgi:hypothetical protein